MAMCLEGNDCGPVVARGLCNKHYLKLRRSREFQPHQKPDKCSAEECDRPSKARNVCTKHYKRLYRAENLDKLQEQDRSTKRTFRLNNPEAGKIYYSAHTESIKAATKRWVKANPNKVRNNVARRRALQKATEVEQLDRLTVFERDAWVCQLCLGVVDNNLKWPDKGFATLDHIVPLSKGGDHTYANVQLAHFGCNLTKADSIVE